MRYLQLEKYLIPVILIKYVEQEETDGVEDGVEVVYTTTVIHLRDGTDVIVDEDYDVVCELLNPPKGVL